MASKCTLNEKSGRPGLAILTLIGLPGSGKTTFVNDFKAHVEKERDNEKKTPIQIVHVCYDDLVPLERQKELIKESDRWKNIRKCILKSVEILLTKRLEICPVGKNEFREGGFFVCFE